jgi:hypothetical protein
MVAKVGPFLPVDPEWYTGIDMKSIGNVALWSEASISGAWSNSPG